MSKLKYAVVATAGMAVGIGTFYGAEKFFSPSAPVRLVAADPVEPPERKQASELLDALSGEKIKNVKLSGDLEAVRLEIVRLHGELGKLSGTVFVKQASPDTKVGFNVKPVLCHAGSSAPGTGRWGSYSGGNFEYDINFPEGSCEYKQVELDCTRRTEPFVKRVEQGFVVAADEEAGCGLRGYADDKFQSSPVSLIVTASIPELDAAIRANPFPVKSEPKSYRTQNVLCHAGSSAPGTGRWGSYSGGNFEYDINFPEGSCEYKQVELDCTRRTEPFVKRVEQGFVVAADEEAGCGLRGYADDKFQRPSNSLIREDQRLHP